jgi:phage/conjugal plasmid C-4 type zinc finger TraR family protein
VSDLVDEAAAASELEREVCIIRAADQIAHPGSIHCEECGSEIPEARRAAAPFATRCIHCQTNFERAGP